MFVLGFCALMDLPKQMRPQALLQCSPQILPALLVLFQGLKRAYESKDYISTLWNVDFSVYFSLISLTTVVICYLIVSDRGEGEGENEDEEEGASDEGELP